MTQPTADRHFEYKADYRVTVEIDVAPGRYVHERITYVGGGTTDRDGTVYLGFRDGRDRLLIPAPKILFADPL